MIKNKLKELMVKKQEDIPNKKKIENLVVFLIILIITIVVINVIWNEEDTEENEELTDESKVLATEEVEDTQEEDEIVKNLEEILSKIDGVGEVKVMLTYSQTSQSVPLYDEETSETVTEETDSEGGTRKITETDSKTEIVYEEIDGNKSPVIQSTITPTIEGAIITAQGAGNATVKSNIVQAVEAVTGVATHKIQVFEMSDD